MTQKIFLIGQKAFVTFKFLFDHKVPRQTVYNYTCSNSKNNWHIIKHPMKGNAKLIYYDSISPSFLEKYKLPEYNEIDILAKETDKKKSVITKTRKTNHIKIIFDYEYQKWEDIVPYYKNRYLIDADLESFCKTFLLFKKCIELKGFHYRLSDLYNAYCHYNDLVFQTLNYRSFCNKIKLAEKKTIEDVLYHGLKNKQSNRAKITTDVIIEIKKHYFQGNKPNHNHILNKVNEYLIKTGRKPISLSSVKRIIGQVEVKNEGMISRYGNSYTENHLMPNLKYIPPQKEGILWQIDGTKFQFAYKTREKKLNYLTYFVVLDGHSKEVIGYSYDDSENSSMALRALEMACVNTGHLPKVIRADRSPAFKSIRFQDTIGSLDKIGVEWKQVHYPKENAYVERFFGVFQESFCKKIPGYIGDGITSSNKDGKPSPELLKKAFSKKNIRNLEELIKLIESTIKEYNDSKKRKNLKAKDKFDLVMQPKKKLDPIKINESQFALLFWNKRTETITGSSIDFNINNINYYYNIYDHNICKNYNNNKVLVFYPENDLSEIILFNMNEEFICKLKRKPRIPLVYAERTPEDWEIAIEHRKSRQLLKNNLKKDIQKVTEQSEKNNYNLPPSLTERSAINKSIREQVEIKAMKEEHEMYIEYSKSKIITETEEEDDSKKAENIYTQKGSLKIIDYG